MKMLHCFIKKRASKLIKSKQRVKRFFINKNMFIWCTLVSRVHMPFYLLTQGIYDKLKEFNHTSTTTGSLMETFFNCKYFVQKNLNIPLTKSAFYRLSWDILKTKSTLWNVIKDLSKCLLLLRHHFCNIGLKSSHL